MKNISRRSLLKHGAMTVTALSIVPNTILGKSHSKLLSCVQTKGSVPPKYICLQLYSLRDDISKDYANTIKEVGRMGYTSVETANYDAERRTFYGRTPSEFKKDMEGAGLTMLSAHTFIGMSREVRDNKNFELMAERWEKCIDDHKAAGAGYIVCAGIRLPQTMEELKTICEYFNFVGKKCKEKGLVFGYHNHDYEFRKVENQSVMIDFMIENSNPEYVTFEMDTYWVVKSGNSPVEYFKKYPGRFKLLHVKDHKELGESGMVGFDAIFKYTDIAGVEHLVVEVEEYDHTPLESVKLSLDYLINNPLVKKNYKS